MKTTKNTLEISVDTWSDPGDYPNALAASPLPSYDYVDGIDGELVVELEADDFECPEDTWDDDDQREDWLKSHWHTDGLNDHAIEELPSGVTHASWEITRVGTTVTMMVTECEAEVPECEPY